MNVRARLDRADIQINRPRILSVPLARLAKPLERAAESRHVNHGPRRVMLLERGQEQVAGRHKCVHRSTMSPSRRSSTATALRIAHEGPRIEAGRCDKANGTKASQDQKK